MRDEEYQRELKRQHLELLKGELRNAEADVHRAVQALADHTRLGYRTEPPVPDLQRRLEYFLNVVDRLRDHRDGLVTMPALQATVPEAPAERDKQLRALKQPDKQMADADLIADLVEWQAPAPRKKAPR